MFAAAGSKQAILKQLRDMALAGDDKPVPVAQRPWYREALAEPDPRRALRLHARNATAIHYRSADVHEVLRAAAASDKDLHDLWRASEDERRGGARIVVDALLQKSRLKAGLDRAAAIDIMWILTSSDIFWRLVHTRRWSLPSTRTGSATRYANNSCRQPTGTPGPDIHAGFRIDDGPTRLAPDQAAHYSFLPARGNGGAGDGKTARPEPAAAAGPCGPRTPTASRWIGTLKAGSCKGGWPRTSRPAGGPDAGGADLTRSWPPSPLTCPPGWPRQNRPSPPGLRTSRSTAPPGDRGGDGGVWRRVGVGAVPYRR